MKISGTIKKKLFIGFFFLVSIHGNAQSLLGRIVSISAKKEPLSQVLQSISQQGNFFSLITAILLEVIVL